ncbi:hypothetical protein D3C79_704520 [compost metagenome]
MRLAIEQRQRQVATFKHLFELCTPCPIGAWHYKVHAGYQLAQALRRIQEQRPQAPDFPATAARHQGNHRPCTQPQRHARSLPIRSQWYGIGQRMADEPYRHALLFIEACFEWQQRQHQIATFTNLQHTLLPPCPDRRADVVHGLDTGLA